jgi:recombination protein RecR
MAGLPEPISSLIAALSKLPGIGPRSAERIGLHIVQADKDTVRRLSEVLIRAREVVQACSICGGLTEHQPCSICNDSRRDGTIICVVEKPVDIFIFEKSGTFRGRFHVLGGKISPLNGVEPEDLRIGELEKRIGPESIQELILALPSDVEGDATSHYLSRFFSGRNVKVSRIAQGLPVGSGLEFADELTLSRALEGRREFL